VKTLATSFLLSPVFSARIEKTSALVAAQGAAAVVDVAAVAAAAYLAIRPAPPET
jgi:hypothetical protein